MSSLSAVSVPSLSSPWKALTERVFHRPKMAFNALYCERPENVNFGRVKAPQIEPRKRLNIALIFRRLRDSILGSFHAAQNLHFQAARSIKTKVPALILSATSLYLLPKSPLSAGLFVTPLAVRAWAKKRGIQQEKRAAGLEKFTAIFALQQSYLGIFFHEAGHALTALACFKGAKPKISITPFVRGATSYKLSSKLMPLGKWLGRENAKLLIGAGGMAASSLISLAACGSALLVKKKNPETAESLLTFGSFQLVGEINYGLFSLIYQPKTLSNDFMLLFYKGGIHPLVPLAIMGTLLAVTLLCWARQIKRRST